MLRDASGKMVLTNGWKIFHIVVAIILLTAIILLSVFLGLSRADGKSWMAMSENNMESAYYTLTDSLLNIENNFSKLRVTRDGNLAGEMLIDVAMDSQTAAANLAILSYSGYDMSALVKFCNQVGDYSKYLVTKLTGGEELSEEDYNTLAKLYEATYSIGKKLNAVKDALMSGEKIVTGLDEFNSQFTEIADSLVDGSIKYPSLIYDGAFSDSLEERQPKALSGEDIDPEKQQDNIAKILCDYEIKSVKYTGESDNGFTAYVYDITLEDGSNVYLQLAKKGGSIVMWDKQFDSQQPTLSVEEGVVLAEQYMQKQGYENVKGVYACVSDSVLYVNICYVENDIVLYPDMIKIKVSLDDGKIIGFEGLNYIYNHTERSLKTPSVTEGEVRNMNFGGLEVQSVRLALIPLDNGKESLTYEVYGKVDNYAYYVFIDAMTGKAVEVLQVIDSDEGELLM